KLLSQYTKHVQQMGIRSPNHYMIEMAVFQEFILAGLRNGVIRFAVIRHNASLKATNWKIHPVDLDLVLANIKITFCEDFLYILLDLASGDAVGPGEECVDWNSMYSSNIVFVPI
ncbi:hypothetical protein ACJX0J_006363, partial [Zea mays]